MLGWAGVAHPKSYPRQCRRGWSQRHAVGRRSRCRVRVAPASALPVASRLDQSSLQKFAALPPLQKRGDVLRGERLSP